MVYTLAAAALLCAMLVALSVARSQPGRLYTPAPGKRPSFWARQDEKAYLIKFLLAVALSRLVLWALVLAVMAIHNCNINPASFFAEFGDVPHYMHIAQYGYTNAGDEYDKLIVFYPLYPLLIRGLWYVVRDYMAAGYIISAAATLAACGYFYKLVRLDYSREVSSNSVLLWMLYPVAFFAMFVYTEGLFVLLCLMCIYYARKGKWLACGLAGMLASLTRNQGFILVGVAVYEYLVQTRQRSDGSLKGFFKALRPGGLWTLAIPMGFVGYLCINKALFGDFFAFLNFQAAPPWYNTVGFFAAALHQQYDMAVAYPGLSMIIYVPQIVLFFVTAALILTAIRQRVRTSYVLFMIAYTLMSYISMWLISGMRYMFSCFMLQLPLALLATRHKGWRLALYAGLPAMFVAWLILYIKGYAIM